MYTTWGGPPKPFAYMRFSRGLWPHIHATLGTQHIHWAGRANELGTAASVAAVAAGWGCTFSSRSVTKSRVKNESSIQRVV